MMVDKEIIPGCWMWLGPVRSRGGRPSEPVTKRGGVTASRFVWEQEVGPLERGDRLRRNPALCMSPLCVNPDHFIRRNAQEAEEIVAQAIAEGATISLAAERAGVSVRHAQRISPARQAPRAPSLDAAGKERALRLLEEGVPDSWVAEDVRAPLDTVRELRVRAGILNRDWVRVQASVRHNAALLPLHEQFNPRIGVTL